MSDSTEWDYLEDVLEELGMTEAELREAHPGIDLDHVGLDGRRIVDRRSLSVGEELASRQALTLAPDGRRIVDRRSLG
jgi:hypothetical protein